MPHGQTNFFSGGFSSRSLGDIQGSHALPQDVGVESKVQYHLRRSEKGFFGGTTAADVHLGLHCYAGFDSNTPDELKLVPKRSHLTVRKGSGATYHGYDYLTKAHRSLFTKRYRRTGESSSVPARRVRARLPARGRRKECYSARSSLHLLRKAARAAYGHGGYRHPDCWQ